jgi:hypothetical protein
MQDPKYGKTYDANINKKEEEKILYIGARETKRSGKRWGYFVYRSDLSLKSCGLRPSELGEEKKLVLRKFDSYFLIKDNIKISNARAVRIDNVEREYLEDLLQKHNL